MFTIKVGVMPGRIEEVVVEVATVQEVITMAGLEAEGYEVRVNGVTTTDVTAPITADGTVLLVRKVKGNAEITLKVGMMPGKIEQYVVTGTETVDDILAMANLSREGYEVRVNGSAITGNPVVTESGTVLLVKMVKGN